MGNADDDLVLE